MDFVKNIDLNKENRLNYIKKNLKNRIVGDNGYCEGHVIKVSKFPSCYKECKKNANCAAIRYIPKSKYCDLLSNCTKSRNDPNWKIKIVRSQPNNKKNPFRQFPLRRKIKDNIPPIPIHIFLLENFCILVIIGIFFYQIYKFFKIFYITLPENWKYK